MPEGNHAKQPWPGDRPSTMSENSPYHVADCEDVSATLPPCITWDTGLSGWSLIGVRSAVGEQACECAGSWETRADKHGECAEWSCSTGLAILQLDSMVPLNCAI